MGTEMSHQVASKQQRAADQLSVHIPSHAWLPAATSPQVQFRNKAKLAVGGTPQRPTLGLALPGSAPIDLRECGIHTHEIWQIIPDLAGFVTLTGLAPYDPTTDRGQFKFIHVLASPAGRLMLRFVVRDEAAVSRIREVLPALLKRLPQVEVASANVLAEHRAALAGEVEIPLTDQRELRMQLNDVELFVRAHSFFQTNSGVAAQLYSQARAWADEVSPASAVDIYCGVGGFAWHLAAPERRVRGIEVEPSAIDCARLGRTSAGGQVDFTVNDGTSLPASDLEADLIVVNPPRRGIGPLAAQLNDSPARTIIYSSCNPQSLARDLDGLTNFAVRQAKLFDMFPHTEHSEVAVLLARK